MRHLRDLMLCLALALAGATGLPAAATAQSLGRIVSPILTINRDRLFAETLFGKRVNSELEASSTAMAAETRKIEAALEEEEKALTAERATLDTATFREKANAFDEKVQALRSERDTAEKNLRARIDAAQQVFFKQIGPVLGAMVRERGAVLILDSRAILLTAADVDITDAAIVQIDAVLGDGSALAPSDDAAPVDTIPAPADPQPDAPETTGDTLPVPDTVPSDGQ